MANRETLIQLMSDVLTSAWKWPAILSHASAKPLEHWLETFRGKGFPFAPINDMKRTFDHPQAIARGVVVEVEHPRAGRIKQLAPAVS